MFFYLTGNANNTVALEDFTITAHFLYRRAYFHDKQTLYFFFLAFFARNVTLPLFRS